METAAYWQGLELYELWKMNLKNGGVVMWPAVITVWRRGCFDENVEIHVFPCLWAPKETGRGEGDQEGRYMNNRTMWPLTHAPAYTCAPVWGLRCGYSDRSAGGGGLSVWWLRHLRVLYPRFSFAPVSPDCSGRFIYVEFRNILCIKSAETNYFHQYFICYSFWAYSYNLVYKTSAVGPLVVMLVAASFLKLEKWPAVN